jgi:hypothetical protein
MSAQADNRIVEDPDFNPGEKAGFSRRVMFFHQVSGSPLRPRLLTRERRRPLGPLGNIHVRAGHFLLETSLPVGHNYRFCPPTPGQTQRSGYARIQDSCG